MSAFRNALDRLAGAYGAAAACCDLHPTDEAAMRHVEGWRPVSPNLASLAQVRLVEVPELLVGQSLSRGLVTALDARALEDAGRRTYCAYRQWLAANGLSPDHRMNLSVRAPGVGRLDDRGAKDLRDSLDQHRSGKGECLGGVWFGDDLVYEPKRGWVSRDVGHGLHGTVDHGPDRRWIASIHQRKLGCEVSGKDEQHTYNHPLGHELGRKIGVRHRLISLLRRFLRRGA